MCSIKKISKFISGLLICLAVLSCKSQPTFPSSSLMTASPSALPSSMEATKSSTGLPTLTLTPSPQAVLQTQESVPITPTLLPTRIISLQESVLIIPTLLPTPIISLQVKKLIDKAKTEANSPKIKDNINLAISTLDEAIKLENKYAYLFSRRADLKNFKNRYEDALQDINQAIKLEPGDPNFYSIRSLSYSGLARHYDAKENIDYALKLSIHNPKFYAYLISIRAYVYAEEKLAIGDYQEVIKIYTEAIKANPLDHGLYIARGGVYEIHLRKLEEAILDYQQAVKLGAGDPVQEMIDYIQQQQVETLLQLREEEQRITRFIKANPNFAALYKDRAYIYKKLNLYQKSIEDFKKYLLLENNPQDKLEIEEEIKKLNKIGS